MDVKGIDNLKMQAQQYELSIKENYAAPVTNEPPENTKPVKGQTDKGGDEQQLSEKEQQRRMARLQDTLKNHNIEISYNDEVNRYSIKVLDSESQEVVKEIPSEKSLEMFARMLEIEGLLWMRKDEGYGLDSEFK